MKKIILILFCISIFPSILFALEEENVDYEIIDYIVEASLDISGNMKVKEVIGVKGTYNTFIRNISYRNSELPKFTGIDSDFKESDIYNASNVILYNVGTIDYKGILNFDVFNKKINKSEECLSEKKCYSLTNTKDGISVKMFNETKDGITYFYIEYLLGNVVVMHEDVAELYYNFIGSSFPEIIKNYKLRVILPNETKDSVKVWAHGPLNGVVKLIKNDVLDTYYGGYLEVSNIEANTPVDMRIVFPKNLINVDHFFLKKSNTLALNKILIVENARIEEANDIRKGEEILRKNERKNLIVMYFTSIIYIVLTLCIIIYIYIKYDREFKSRFKGPYYKEFIDDYDVTHIEYLFKKDITENAFSTSILNMIYKGNIKCIELGNDNFEFTLINKDGLSSAEKQIINILFNESGSDAVTSLDNIRKYARKIENNSSSFINLYNNWKDTVIKDSIKDKFYEDNLSVKLAFALYSLLGFLVILIHISIKEFNILTTIVFFLTLIYIIYLMCFTKRTRKGANHYAKWKGFKKFIKDFSKFNEKKLPRVELWERYLVYASIFNLTDELSKVMKMKFDELGYGDNEILRNKIFTNYMLWGSLNNSIKSIVSSSVNLVSKNEVKSRWYIKH